MNNVIPHDMCDNCNKKTPCYLYKLVQTIYVYFCKDCLNIGINAIQTYLKEQNSKIPQSLVDKVWEQYLTETSSEELERDTCEGINNNLSK